MENINLSIFSIVVSLVFLGLAIYYSKSKRRYFIGNSTYVLLCLITSAQWFYVSVFLFGNQNLDNLSLGNLVIKLLLPILIIIPALVVLIGELASKQRKDPLNGK